MGKFNFKEELAKVELNSGNTIVIGSGILDALKLRESGDIDLVVTEERYKELSNNPRFKKERKRGKEYIIDGLLEINTSWTVIGKTWKFDDLLNQSVVIGGVRYNTVQFLLGVKRCWVTDGEARQKDIDDVKLMENYLKK